MPIGKIRYNTHNNLKRGHFVGLAQVLRTSRRPAVHRQPLFNQKFDQKLEPQENYSKLKQKTQGFRKYEEGTTKIDSNKGEDTPSWL